MTKLRGRPPKVPGKPRRRHIAFRLTEQMYAGLEQNAKLMQRSISEEIEYRLDRTFRDDEVLAAIAELGPPRRLMQERDGQVVWVTGSDYATKQHEVADAITEITGVTMDKRLSDALALLT